MSCGRDGRGGKGGRGGPGVKDLGIWGIGMGLGKIRWVLLGRGRVVRTGRLEEVRGGGSGVR